MFLDSFNMILGYSFNFFVLWCKCSIIFQDHKSGPPRMMLIALGLFIVHRLIRWKIPYEFLLIIFNHIQKNSAFCITSSVILLYLPLPQEGFGSQKLIGDMISNNYSSALSHLINTMSWENNKIWFKIILSVQNNFEQLI